MGTTGNKPGARRAELLLSGGFGKSTNSARAGFLPIRLERTPVVAFEGIAVYLRPPSSGKADEKDSFTLYTSDSTRFTEQHRQRLMDQRVQFVYIPIASQSRFRQQTEANLVKITQDPSLAVSVRSQIIYETSVELVNELLAEPDLSSKTPRLEQISRAVTTLTLNDPGSFAHLFTASHHDFYTATHMVNVATWMVPLAYAMGFHDIGQLNHLCQAGILHDIGKIYVPSDVLNKKGRLSDGEWNQIRRHPELGCEHLKSYDNIPPLVYTVTRQHHERLDGSGYPDRLKGDQIDIFARICAVVDSFDAMTAFRPFKERTMSVSQAVDVIVAETPSKYDQAVVDAWIGLLEAAEKQSPTVGPVHAANPGNGQRRYPRFPIDCPARAHLMEPSPSGPVERRGMQVVAHSISRAGVGFLSPQAFQPGDGVRVYLQGSGSLSRMLEGLIVRCRVYRDGWYEVGVEFAALMEEAQVGPIAVSA